MNGSRTYCTAIARAICELDKCSLRGPQTGQDKRDWDQARNLLITILDRNDYELAIPGNRLKKRKR